MSQHTPAVFTSQDAHRLYPVPRYIRRRCAARLLRDGAATLRCVANAYYGGDMEAAKAELYPKAGAPS